MQTSAGCPMFSDGARKTITTKAPSKAPAVVKIARPGKVAATKAPRAPRVATPKAAPAAHRSGGFVKHARRAK